MLFDQDPRMGFLAQVEFYAAKIAAGGSAKELSDWGHLKFNGQVDAFVTAFFLIAVGIIFLGCLREWIRLLSGAKQPVLHEDPYVSAPEAA